MCPSFNFIICSIQSRTWWNSFHAQKVMGIIAAAGFPGMISDIKGKFGMVPLPAILQLPPEQWLEVGKLWRQWVKVTKLTPFEGFSAETAECDTLQTQHFKIPVEYYTLSPVPSSVWCYKQVSAVQLGSYHSADLGRVLTISGFSLSCRNILPDPYVRSLKIRNKNIYLIFWKQICL